MYTEYTYQDWLAAGDRLKLVLQVISTYKASEDFRNALMAQKYFVSENEAVGRKKLLQPQSFTVRVKEETPHGEVTREKAQVRQVEIEGNRIYSRFFYRIITQENQHLLGNGVTISEKGDIKARLGLGFDTTMQAIGEKALIDGVCWGYWNLDHIEPIDAVKDARSGFVALVDEETSAPMVGIQFWQLSDKRPLYVRLFEMDGVTIYRADANGNLTEHKPKRPYVLRVSRDALGEQVIGGNNYTVLPLVPLYANPEKRSEFDNAIKSKIDAYDRIFSDFGDNLDKANDIYWVLNNFGGNSSEVAQMLEQISKLRAVVNISDGVGGGSTAEPHSFEVPHEARKVALEILEKQIYKDAMALDMGEVTGGSLTNVAIKAAMTNLDLKCDRYEWQAFSFVQGMLRMIGIDTEKISFVRKTLVNQSETVRDIATMRQDIDLRTALKLNPYIDDEQIDQIVSNMDAEIVTGQPSMKELNDLLREVE